MARVKPRKSWATWFEHRHRMRRYMAKGGDPVILALMENVALRVVRQTVPRIVDAAVHRKL